MQPRREIAYTKRMPMIWLIDSAGAREMARTKRVDRPWRRHGVMPV